MKKLFSTLLFFFCCFYGYSQNDCADALIVCGNTNYEDLSATGVGTQELATNNSCASMEHNSLWLELPIKTGGTLGFTLIPENPSIIVDFDFFIFGPNVNCGNLGQAIRCSTTNPQAAGSSNNHTGMNSSETDISEGPGMLGNNFVQSLTVQAGESYFLVIDRPIGASNFSIEWTGTAAFNDIPHIDPNIVLDQQKCDSDAVDDQSTLFDLSLNTATLIAGQSNVALSFHKNTNDAIVGENPIPNPQAYSNTSNPEIIFMRLTNTITGCYSTEEFRIEVINPMETGTPENLILCDENDTELRKFDLSINDEAIQNGNAQSSVTYYASMEDAQNQTNPIGPIYQNAAAYAEEEIWARLDSTGACWGHAITSFSIEVNPVPEIDYSLELSDLNGFNNSIRIKIDSPEIYEFSIDGEHYGSTPYFDQLSPGIYTVSVRDKLGCSELSKEVTLLDYPKFFTPNADGHNEVWKIPYLKPNSKIKIFDRYGKLLSTSKRWDGTYNGKRMPSSEYWFLLELENNRQIRGHFSLIR